MKSLKLLATAALLAVGLAEAASAQAVIHISGAPAFRQVGTTAINNVLTANVAAHGGTLSLAYVGSNILTANQVTWTGGNINGTSVTIKISYTGSTAGIEAVAGQQKVKFLPDSANGGGANQADPTSGSNANDLQIPDFTLSDEWQASTPFNGVANLTGTSVNYQSLNDDIAGILPYRFVANRDAPARLNNITPQLAQLLFITGSVPLSQFTGLASDEGTTVWATGRDIGSGLRTVLLSETGIGVSQNINQYQATISSTAAAVLAVVPYVSGTGYSSANPPLVTFSGGGGSGAAATAVVTNGGVSAVNVTSGGSGYTSTPTITFSGTGAGASATVVVGGGYVTGQALFPAATVAGVSEVKGDGGFSTFNALLPSLVSNTNSGGGAIHGYYVTALAAPDAAVAIAGGAHELTWNGYSLGTLGTAGPSNTASPSLAEGQYSFWSYIHLHYLTLGATQQATETAIFNQLHDHDATVLLQDVNVSRVAPDGSNVLSGGNIY